MKKFYNSFSLSTQLQTTFAFAVLVLSAIIILINGLLLQWVESKIISLSTSNLHSQVLSKLQLQGDSQSKYIENELKKYLQFNKNHKNLIRLAFNQLPNISQPFVNSEPLWVADISPGINYFNCSQYSSKFGKPPQDSLAYQTVQNATRIDWILPGLNNSVYLNIYIGLKESEILVAYPAMYFNSWTSYTPIVREWYHFAFKDPSQTEITEPYQDILTGNWVITISDAIVINNESFIGVAGVDVEILSITSLFENSMVPDLGFMLLVTKTGLIISKPPSWNIGQAVRLYDEKKTGFSLDLWKKVQAARNGDQFKYRDVNGTDYSMILNLIRPFENTENTTHYLMLFANSSFIDIPSDDLRSHFKYITVVLFWTIFAFQLAIMVLALVLIYLFSVEANRKLSAVSKIFSKIRRRALYQNLTKTVNIKRLLKEREGIDDLAKACIGKIKRIEDQENEFSYFNWKNTRPNDDQMYDQWLNYIYPFSRYNESGMKWRKTLRNFRKISEEDELNK